MCVVGHALSSMRAMCILQGLNLCAGLSPGMLNVQHDNRASLMMLVTTTTIMIVVV